MPAHVSPLTVPLRYETWAGTVSGEMPLLVFHPVPRYSMKVAVCGATFAPTRCATACSARVRSMPALSPPGSGEASIAQEQFLRLDAQCRLPASQIRRKAPVRRDAAAVEQPGRREYLGARAHCNHASSCSRAFS